MKTGTIKILVCIILIWFVSATYSYYIFSKNTPTRFSYLSENDEGIFSRLWSKITPGKVKLKAKAAIAVDAATGKVVFAKNQNHQLPIASLTKLTTALVFLETNPDLSNVITITESDKNGSGKSKLCSGEAITLNDCLHVSLMCSDNVATRARARSTGLSEDEFVFLMNKLAADLGMKKTCFVEPTGLMAGNVSTAIDYVKLIKRAFENEIIAGISTKKSYQFKPRNRNIIHTLYNTNRLLYSDWNIKGGKTGYISQSGYCLALDVADDSGREITALLLGSPSNKHRYRDAYRLMTYAMKN